MKWTVLLLVVAFLAAGCAEPKRISVANFTDDPTTIHVEILRDGEVLWERDFQVDAYAWEHAEWPDAVKGDITVVGRAGDLQGSLDTAPHLFNGIGVTVYADRIEVSRIQA